MQKISIHVDLDPGSEAAARTRAMLHSIHDLEAKLMSPAVFEREYWVVWNYEGTENVISGPFLSRKKALLEAVVMTKGGKDTSLGGHYNVRTTEQLQSKETET